MAQARMAMPQEPAKDTPELEAKWGQTGHPQTAALDFCLSRGDDEVRVVLLLLLALMCRAVLQAAQAQSEGRWQNPLTSVQGCCDPPCCSVLVKLTLRTSSAGAWGAGTDGHCAGP